MSKHQNLSRIWAEGGLGDDAKYKAYRKVFRSEDVFPNDKHFDHDPMLTDLKGKFDLCSKLIHGSPLGMAGHFERHPKEPDGAWNVNFVDMPEDTFVSSFTFFHILGSHCMILQLFGRILAPYARDGNAWNEKFEKEYLHVEGKIRCHMEKRLPDIAALYSARNDGTTLISP